jgi:4,5-dihydroxyphthalate decarboxylase
VNPGPLQLTLASLDYLDRTRALVDGTIKAEGIELTCLQFGPHELFQRVAQKVEFDIAEMSASTYMSLFSLGDRRYVAIPVFLSRHFRHGYMFVHGPSEIRSPGDLVGRRVGVPEYEMTAALWQRAVLMHDYGVTPEQIEWWQGGEFRPGFMERLKLPVPAGVSIGVIPDDRTLHDMVAAGDVDAVFCPHVPAGLTDGTGRVRRLFPDFVSIEREYFQRTGFFPIMHLTVVRRELYEAHPWVAAALVKAFAEAQAIGWRRLTELGALAVMLPWLTRDVEEASALMGPSPWPYGFGENYAILKTMCGFSYEQGLSTRLLSPEELFAPETQNLSLGPTGKPG